MTTPAPIFSASPRSAAAPLAGARPAAMPGPTPRSPERRRFLAIGAHLGLAGAVSVFAGAGPAWAAGVPPADFIRDLGAELLRMLNDRSISQAGREAEFRRLFLKGVDIELIARFTLGRYWRDATDQERADYRRLFEDWIVKSYVHRLSAFAGETFAVREARTIGERETLVTTIIDRPGGANPLRVDWRIREKDNQLRIVDVLVEGISMALTQREEFSTVVARNGGKVGELNNLLRERIAALN